MKSSCCDKEVASKNDLTALTVEEVMCLRLREEREIKKTDAMDSMLGSSFSCGGARNLVGECATPRFCAVQEWILWEVNTGNIIQQACVD
jgi:hypothetical protein